MKTINELNPTETDLENSDYHYQLELTAKLDNLDLDFDQEIINEIVLWKVNRYVALDIGILNLINQIKKTDKELNSELTKTILLKLLDKKQKGVRLPMASSILRFKNPDIYQIIDQRVYRLIYGEELKYSLTNINEQIKLYLDYLIKLRDKSKQHGIEFEKADRVFYSMDKLYNVDERLKR